jgi:hypothetical protein
MLQPEERGLGWHGLPSEWTSAHEALSVQPHCRGLYYLGQDEGDLHGGEGASAVLEDIPLKLQQGHFLTSMGRRFFFLLYCRKSWRNISFPSDISERFHEDITTNISEKFSP